MSTPSLTQASVHWNEQGTPVADAFGDVYFSNDNGLEETRHVFLHHNGLPERWARHDRPLFVVGETGFGTGLNFLALWQSFRHYRQQQPDGAVQRLHFISTEKYPLCQADLRRALTAWPSLADLTEPLLAQYPLPLPGCHRLILDEGRVTLDLWFGDVNDSLPHWPATAAGWVDAWFLDGFAPSKNPQMWQQNLFDQLYRLARPGATLATFTCAGFVRRGLQASGFTMAKVPGHGSKREMLAGHKPDQAEPSPTLPTITLIGGGIASACLADALTRRGQAVRLLCADPAPAQGASGNRQGALYPLLNPNAPVLSQFYATAFTLARRLYDGLSDQVDHAWCGVIQFAQDAKAQRKLQALTEAGYPAQLVEALSPTQRDDLAGRPLVGSAVRYPQGGWLCPAQLTQALLDRAQASGRLELVTDCRIQQVEPAEQGWRLTDQHGRHWPAPTLVVAAGHETPALPGLARLPMHAVRGQVTHLAPQAPLQPLNTVLCYGGYLTPRGPLGHCIGASFERAFDQLDYSAAEQGANLAKLQQALPDEQWPQLLQMGEEARVSVRATVRDHLPIVGPWATARQPLWLLTGLGARGLCSAPLLAEVLAAQLLNEPIPLASDLLAAIDSQRFSADN
ncbi:bifunctional tRNA (5-methylaminomethyl-2-thiouridine)(34)-methyltransferase MnmD/FAD-dependent 5-carboxymethylaminomethyl-2-thiouridine(34) oxidoreductase MnmC [Pseudaeromonas sp. ZJS20]|uniref:bifunctional tRNA (5-methylaminomethyl-2-thiouridine)(34)-methyltransferase MnmD/FAD-dependent 5-carboxymethylaminomethyl-2-thiouridine(34) oxidoreductase MnmC n=1 Tax=Pseudaeromonas aegiceratis TaxID=3153928 RepID=UPI00390C8004